MGAGLGVAMAGGRNGGRDRAPRADDDFMPTPPEGPQALLDAELRFIRHAYRGKVWECACGNGAMSRVLQSEFNVVSTNLADRGYGTTGVDFLKQTELQGDVIITNPPFKLADEFIRKGFSLRPSYMAMLLPSSFWHAAGPTKRRDDLFRQCTPSRVLPLGFRLDFENLGHPVMNCSWSIWEPRRVVSKCELLPSARRPWKKGSVS